jgi:hypothetical protein
VLSCGGELGRRSSIGKGERSLKVLVTGNTQMVQVIYKSLNNCGSRRSAVTGPYRRLNRLLPLRPRPPTPSPLPQNPNKPVAKNHHQMVLRAESASEKYDWLARLRHATEPGVGSRARGVAAPASAAQPGQRQPSQDREPEKEKVGVTWGGVGQGDGRASDGLRMLVGLGLGGCSGFDTWLADFLQQGL